MIGVGDAKEFQSFEKGGAQIARLGKNSEVEFKLAEMPVEKQLRFSKKSFMIYRVRLLC